jgi:hypothetical protein
VRCYPIATNPQPPYALAETSASSCLALADARLWRPSFARDDVPAVLLRVRPAVPNGGERFTASPAHHSDRPGTSPVGAQERRGRASGAARRLDDDELNAYVKEVVDNLPPLTDAQRDLLALIFHSTRYK